ncbi:MAG: WYL domain-containing protein, partial [Actinomycetota bacterium]|nr:WYL domain-containing protein [Actinomycetota bacterium]
LPGASTQERSGGLEVKLPFSNVDALIVWLIGFGAEVELIAPPDARRRLLQHVAPYGGQRR